MISYASRHHPYEPAPPPPLRSEMVLRDPIIARMTSDLAGVDWHAGTEITETYFTLLGWTKTQVDACAAQAIERSRARQEAGRTL